MKIHTYHVMDGNSGKWLADDERSWTADFQEAAAFLDAKLAQDIAVRELGEKGFYYVMACMSR